MSPFEFSTLLQNALEFLPNYDPCKFSKGAVRRVRGRSSAAKPTGVMLLLSRLSSSAVSSPETDVYNR